MISKIVIVAVLCVTCILAEAPLNRYRFQRLRQPPSRQFFARQEAPYPDASQQGGEPKAEYGPPKPVYGPPSTPPPPQYGPPPSTNGDTEITNTADNPDSEVVGQPSRLTQSERLTLPTKKSPQKFSQRLELQQQVQQFPNQQFPHQQIPNQQFPNQQFVTPVQQVVAPAQLAAIQEGFYYIQLPNGAIQRVEYFTQPSLVDNSVLANLQFRPVAEVQATVAEPQLFVNTLVQSHVTADE